MKAYAVARTAASVGVTTPLKIAYKIRGGNASAGMAWRMTRQAIDQLGVPAERGKFNFLAAKAIDIKNELTGNKIHSIKLEETYYYPYSIYTPKTKK